MELKEFVSDALAGIIAGVAQAQSRVKDIAVIEPNINAANPKGGSSDSPHKILRSAEFDIAVSVSDEVKGGAKSGIFVLGLLGIGGGVDERLASKNVSRIKFSVSYVFRDDAERE